MQKLLALIFLSSVMITTAWAKDNDCANFHIQISNSTKSACVLTSQKVEHGRLITSPPLSILPNDSKRFDMSQTLYGPAIMLSYQCGSEIITITSQQNYCFMEAGDISGNILHPLPQNLNANYAALTGSYYWGRSGSINWSIVDNSMSK